MIASRTPNSVTFRSVVSSIQQSYTQLSLFQRQVSSGLRINVPSDDPVGTSRVLSLRNSIGQLDQYTSNINYALDEMSGVSSVMDNVLDLMGRAKEIAISATNVTRNQPMLDAYAYQIDEIIQTLLSYANTAINDKYVFSGYGTDAQSFTVTANTPPPGPPVPAGLIQTIAYNAAGGADQGQRQIEVARGRYVTINIAGSSPAPATPGVFVDAATGTDIFTNLINMRNNLFNGNITAILAVDEPALSNYVAHLQSLSSTYGVKMQELYNLKDTHQSESLYKTGLKVEIEEVDAIEAMANMSYAQVSYQAALNVGAKLFSLNLFDFIG